MKLLTSIFLSSIFSIAGQANASSAPAVPAVVAPVPSVVSGVAIGPNYATIKMSWMAGIRVSANTRYELEDEINGAAYKPVELASDLSSSTNLNLVLGTTHRYRVKAYDNAGAPGNWLEGPRFTVQLDREESPSISYTGKWEKALSGAPRNWGAADRFMLSSSTQKSSATYSFTGTSVAWVATVGPDKGTADVSMDGKKVATVDLHSDEPRYGQVVFARDGLSSGPHKIEVLVLENKEVNVDAFLRLN